MMLDAQGGRPQTTKHSPAARAQGGLLVTGLFVVLLFAIEFVNAATFHALNRTFGLRPRSADGLLDILTFPLFHANLGHVVSNALPLIIFGFLVFMSGLRVFVTAVAFSWLGSGMMVWLIGGWGITVGASGLVFGLFAFLLVRGFFNRSWWQIALSVLLFLSYGGILFGVLPGVAGFVSWQAHLGGALGGVAAAVLLKPRRLTRGRLVAENQST
jgi:membrane associated rhomboid family serine protease